MTDTTRGRRSLRTVIAVLAGVLFALVFFSDSPPYDPWALVAFVAYPAAIGIVVATGFMLLRRGGSRPILSNRDPFSKDTSSDVINMSRIRVAGLGGLGMVVIALVLAIAYPRIGQALLIGVAGGIVAAAIVIAYRRRSGPLASGGKRTRGRSVLLAADDDEPTPRRTGETEPLLSVQPARLPGHAVR